ncbi:hypothetical protein EFA69_15045 [Rufibacter immobilis]|uniref:Uncharacterized protein n=1 Tax=Rufibacter immobilis TaxID=1348778 RepID=A0A3M9MPJ3_9BACT|nr:hypothetical protein [Rufibacter immobilis]RNI27446.1 hypothetical protein EFA69_15045 [Rufibacter immobilis]
MEELRKLIQIVEKRAGKPNHIFIYKSKEERLYDEIVNGKITDDHTGYSILYKSGQDGKGLKMIKSRLRKKLMNQLFFLDEDNDDIGAAIEQSCLTKYYQAKVLVDSGANDLAAPILHQVIKKAKEFDFNYIVSLCTRTLLQVYMNLNERSKFYKVKEQLEKIAPRLEADQESEILFMEAKVELSYSVSARKNYLTKVKPVIERLLTIWTEARTFKAFNNYYRLSVWLHELQGNFEDIITLTNQFNELTADNDAFAKRFDIKFNQFIQVYAYLRCKRLEEGLALANTYYSSFDQSSNNWFAYMENYILLAIHAKKYDVAHLLLHQVQTNPFIKKINKLAQERWVIFEAYLHFVAPQSEQPTKWITLLQNAQNYSKDKEGFNVAILILQVMYYLEIVDFEALEYRVESLKKYAQNHFKDSFSERSRTFFKLLAVLVRSNFDPLVTQKKGQYLYTKLQRTPTPGDAYAEIEIIPYEHLWELILERLKRVN